MYKVRKGRRELSPVGSNTVIVSSSGRSTNYSSFIIYQLLIIPNQNHEWYSSFHWVTGLSVLTPHSRFPAGTVWKPVWYFAVYYFFILHCYNEVKLFWFRNKAFFRLLYPAFQHTHEHQHRHGGEGNTRYLFCSHRKMASIPCQWWKPKREPGSAECAGHSSVFTSDFLLCIFFLMLNYLSLCVFVSPFVHPSFLPFSVCLPRPGSGWSWPTCLASWVFGPGGSQEDYWCSAQQM